MPLELPSGDSQAPVAGQFIPGLEKLFQELANQWRKETRILSSIQAKIYHPCYPRIIGLGTPVLPLIFTDLRDNGGLWYWALECITGDNPATNATTLDEQKRAWLEYATAKGYLGE
ncbi:MAG: hypothetical protein FJW32_01615 [Acidobacteria bacterium]|nr:hypothetical protein [Acidobacteriota bacterium]